MKHIIATALIATALASPVKGNDQDYGQMLIQNVGMCLSAASAAFTEGHLSLADENLQAVVERSNYVVDEMFDRNRDVMYSNYIFIEGYDRMKETLPENNSDAPEHYTVILENCSMFFDTILQLMAAELSR